jgi:hypothetical protein
MPSAGEHTAIRSQFPYGMRNAAATYASSVITDMAAYEDLPGHHLLAVWNLIATTTSHTMARPANNHLQPHTVMPSGTSPTYQTQ